MSYARSPRPVCSTTIGTRPMCPPVTLSANCRNHQRRVAAHFVLNFGGVDQPVERLALQQRLSQRAAAVLGLIARPDPGRLPWVRLRHPLDLLLDLLDADLQPFLSRHGLQQHLALQRAYDVGTEALLELLA